MPECCSVLIFYASFGILLALVLKFCLTEKFYLWKYKQVSFRRLAPAIFQKASSALAKQLVAIVTSH